MSLKHFLNDRILPKNHSPIIFLVYSSFIVFSSLSNEIRNQNYCFDYFEINIVIHVIIGWKFNFINFINYLIQPVLHCLITFKVY